jgi:hypothetical protein
MVSVLRKVGEFSRLPPKPVEKIETEKFTCLPPQPQRRKTFVLASRVRRGDLIGSRGVSG